MNANTEIDFFKLEIDNKVKSIKIKSKQIDIIKYNQVKSIQERIEREK